MIFILKINYCQENSVIYYIKDESDNEKNNWFIKDGDINGKSSTNDTWMYTFKETLIYDQMIFKTNPNLFKCNCY